MHDMPNISLSKWKFSELENDLIYRPQYMPQKYAFAYNWWPGSERIYSLFLVFYLHRFNKETVREQIDDCNENIQHLHHHLQDKGWLLSSRFSRVVLCI